MLAHCLIALAILNATSAQLTVATPPSLVQCQPVRVSWEGGTPPYILAAIPGGQPAAEALATIASDVPSSPYTWIVNVAAGISVNLKVTDGSGTIQYSSPITIQNSNHADCLGGGDGGGGQPPAPSSSEPTPTPPVSSSQPEEQQPSTSSSSETPSPPPPPPPTPTSSSRTITDAATSTRERITSAGKPLSTPVNRPSGSIVRAGPSGAAVPRATSRSGALSGGLAILGSIALLV